MIERAIKLWPRLDRFYIDNKAAIYSGIIKKASMPKEREELLDNDVLNAKD
jgi:hypothetical protein